MVHFVLVLRRDQLLPIFYSRDRSWSDDEEFCDVEKAWQLDVLEVEEAVERDAVVLDQANVARDGDEGSDDDNQ